MPHNGMGSHQSAAMLKDEWLTPPEILKALGPFDLDPCAPVVPPWKMAEKTYNINDDGLRQAWAGRVWLNAPYGLQTATWLSKLADHGDGVALIFARTETDMFFKYVWNRADAVLFIKGRLYFHHVDGTKASANAGAPSCLVAYGERNVESLQHGGIPGQLLHLEHYTADILSPEQDMYYGKLFEGHKEKGKSDLDADEQAWQGLVERWPTLGSQNQ